MHKDDHLRPLVASKIEDSYNVLPGENWFLYWNTSPSLWREKLGLLKSSQILVPINWSVHSSTGDQYDFADERPETDLKRLQDAADDIGKELFFLLPLGPCPLLQNGGVPSLLSRIPTLDESLFPHVICDQEGSLKYLSSFFDHRVFRGFTQFISELGAYVVKAGISCDIVGFESGYMKKNCFQSYFEDYSKAFDQGLSKYVEHQKQYVNIDKNLDRFVQKKIWSSGFIQTVRQFYHTEAERALAGNWEGFLKISFLGGHPQSLFKRMCEKDELFDYCEDVLNITSREVLTTSVLLAPKMKQKILNRVLSDVVTDSFLKFKLGENSIENEVVSRFQPLSFFEVFDAEPNDIKNTLKWKDLGLDTYLEEYYTWCFFYKDPKQYQFSYQGDEKNDKIFFFQGTGMDKTIFSNILKIFTTGGKIILNSFGMDDVYKKKFEMFFLENHLSYDNVNYCVDIRNVTLGDGRLVLFDADEIAPLSAQKKQTFWERLLATFTINHLILPKSDGIFTSWKFRTAGYNELDYEQIRRLGLYNPGHHKRKIKINLLKNFRLIKFIDEDNVQVTHQSNEVIVELFPHGSIAIDFGVFS